MVEILLAPGEISSHAHDTESFSMLMSGQATLEFNDRFLEMELGIPYIIPANTIHTMKNTGNTIAKVNCGGGGH